MLKEIRKEIETINCKSKWSNGVKAYALELLDSAKETDIKSIKDLLNCLLDGMDSWDEYSYSGKSLKNNSDIVKRLYTEEDAKKFEYGKLMPNKSKTWFDIQADALRYAYTHIREIYIQTQSDQDKHYFIVSELHFESEDGKTFPQYDDVYGSSKSVTFGTHEEAVEYAKKTYDVYVEAYDNNHGTIFEHYGYIIDECTLDEDDSPLEYIDCEMEYKTYDDDDDEDEIDD